MVGQTFINLPVKDLQKTIGFFTALGFKFNAQFTNEQATCMILNDNTFAMLLVENFFAGFTDKEISDATKATEVITCISLNSKQEVDELVAKAIQAGGKSPMPVQDHGWMYQSGFEDLDGHMWEVMYADTSKLGK